MNATSCTSPTTDNDALREVDASCRVPLFMLFAKSAGWLVVASVLGLLASIKFHSPDFLANHGSLTYGRLHPAAVDALLYGFCVQAGLGVVLWIIARLGAAPVEQPWIVGFGAALWNFGVLVGLVLVLLGNSTGLENFEMPRAAVVILFLGYLLVGCGIAFTFHARREKRLEVVHWFLIAALFWFPWIFTTAGMLLTGSPVRGITQAVVAWWYSANLELVWFGLVGLGAILYFLPRLTNRPMNNRPIAIFVFWTLILFASWAGIPASAPLPAWMTSLSTVATVLAVLPAISMATNVYSSMGCAVRNTAGNPPGRFIAFGLLAFVIASIMNAVGALPIVHAFTQLTWYSVAQSELNVYGFFALTMLGAIYYIVPRVTGLEWPRPSWVRIHLFLAAAGIVVFALPLAIGGIIEGIQINDPTVPFPALSHATILWLRVSTMGELAMLLGHLLLAGNIALLSLFYVRKHFVPVFQEAVAALKPAEVKP